MKAEVEIQRAHDLITSVLLDDTLRQQLGEEGSPLEFVADALCWVLEHEHNPTVANNLARLEQWLLSQGFQLKQVQ
jgi:hypothetical protein